MLGPRLVKKKSVVPYVEVVFIVPCLKYKSSRVLNINRHSSIIIVKLIRVFF